MTAAADFKVKAKRSREEERGRQIAFIWRQAADEGHVELLGEKEVEKEQNEDEMEVERVQTIASSVLSKDNVSTEFK
ncbi:hypothetical protein CCACVL1_02436, partial [Corchorus capsularis]